MTHRRSSSPPPRAGTGASGVLLIFVVLCLTALAVLALATARADLSLTARANAHTQAYYAAQAEAAAQLAALDAQLAEARAQAGGDQAAYDGLTAAIAPGGTVTLRAQAGDTHTLVMTLALTPVTSGARYAVTACVLEPRGEWAPQDEIELLH